MPLDKSRTGHALVRPGPEKPLTNDPAKSYKDGGTKDRRTVIAKHRTFADRGPEQYVRTHSGAGDPEENIDASGKAP